MVKLISCLELRFTSRSETQNVHRQFIQQIGGYNFFVLTFLNTEEFRALRHTKWNIDKTIQTEKCYCVWRKQHIYSDIFGDTLRLILNTLFMFAGLSVGKQMNTDNLALNK